jgi:hypothetical protein
MHLGCTVYAFNCFYFPCFIFSSSMSLQLRLFRVVLLTYPDIGPGSYVGTALWHHTGGSVMNAGIWRRKLINHYTFHNCKLLIVYSGSPVMLTGHCLTAGNG